MLRRKPLTELLLRSAVVLAICFAPVLGDYLESLLRPTAGSGTGPTVAGYFHAHGPGDTPHWHATDWGLSAPKAAAEGEYPVIAATSVAPHDHLIDAAAPCLSANLWSEVSHQFEGLSVRLAAAPASAFSEAPWPAVGARGPPSA